MADSDPVLVSRVLEILSDPALQEIHFTYNGLTVTGMRYSCLKQYIADGSLSLVVGPVSDAEEAHFNATHALPLRLIPLSQVHLDMVCRGP